MNFNPTQPCKDEEEEKEFVSEVKSNPSSKPFDIALVYHVKLSIIISSLLFPSHSFDLKTIFPLSSPIATQ